MKKFIISALFCGLVAIVAPSYSLAGIEGQVDDQTNQILNYIGCMTIGNNNRAQTFKPSLNRLLDVEAMFSDKVSGTQITLTIKKESTGETIGTSTHSLTVNGQGWEPFTFDEPFLTLTPEESYGMYFTANDNDTKWCYGGDTYARGQAKGFPEYDFVFVEVGKNVATASSSSTASTAAATTASTASQTTSVKKSSSASASSVSSGASASDTAVTTDANLIATAETASINQDIAGMFSRTSIWLYIGILLVIIALGIGIFFYIKRKKKTPETEVENKL